MMNEVDGSRAPSLPWRVEEAHAAEVELERARWKAITAFVDLLTADERLAPGYYSDPSWSVKDLIAHLGAWMVEARVQLLDISARSYAETLSPALRSPPGETSTRARTPRARNGTVSESAMF